MRFISPEQYGGDNSRIVNFNRGYASARPEKGQKGIHLRAGHLPADFAGLVTPCIGSPNVVEAVIVDESYILSFDHTTENMAKSIGHELGHAIGLMHPGDYIERECFGQTRKRVAPQGGITSGDHRNIMRYTNADAYIWQDDRCYPYPSGDYTIGTYVNSLKGTGLNGGEAGIHPKKGHPIPVAGDASNKNTMLWNMTLTSDEPRLCH